MANTIKLKRGLNASRTFVPAQGEPIYTTDTKELHIGDGTTVGGVSVYKSITDKLGAVSGIATLDSNGKVPLTQINDSIIGQVEYKGGWNASTNTPTLPDATTVKGNYYITTVSGTYNSISFVIGDWVISDGTAWGKVDNTDAVSSVFGRTGVVTAQSGDYTTTQVTEGTNLYFTTARAQSAITGAASSITTSNLTASKALVSDASGKVAASTITSTELGYLSGVTSSLQTQINGKEPSIASGTISQYLRGDKSWQTLNTTAVAEGTNLYFTNARAQSAITGAASSIVTNKLTPTKALVSDAAGNVTVSWATEMDLYYLQNTTSNVQDQLNAKVDLTSSQTITGTKNFTSHIRALYGSRSGFSLTIANTSYWVLIGTLNIASRYANCFLNTEVSSSIASSNSTQHGFKFNLYVGVKQQNDMSSSLSVCDVIMSNMVNISPSRVKVVKTNDDASLKQVSIYVQLDSNPYETINWNNGFCQGYTNSYDGVTGITPIANPNPSALPEYAVTSKTSYFAGSVSVPSGSGYAITGGTSSQFLKADGSIDSSTYLTSAYFNGAVSTILTSNLTALKALVSDSSGKVAASTITSTELGYLSGVTSSLQTQISGKEPTITAGTTAQYWRGDKSWQTLNKSTIGLGNVENTALSTWAGSSNITTIGTLSSGTVPWTRLSNVPNILTTDTAQSITALKTFETYPNFGLYPNKVWNGISCFSDGAKAAKTYRKLFTLPVSSASNKGIVTVKGLVCGHTFAQGKADIEIVFNSRDFSQPVSKIVGTLGICDIEMYRESDNSFTVYAVANSGSIHPWNLTISGDFSNSSTGATYSYDSSVETTSTPTGTIEWTLSTDYTNRSYINSNSNTGLILNSSVSGTNSSLLFSPVKINRSILTCYSDGLFKYRSFDAAGTELDQPFTIDNTSTDGDITLAVGSGITRRTRVGNNTAIHANMDPGVWAIATKTVTGTNIGYNREAGVGKTSFINRVASGNMGGYSFRRFKADTTTETNLLDIDYLGNATFLGNIIKSGGTSSQYLMADGSVTSITGAINGLLTTNLTASKALVSDSSGKIAASTVTSTELGYLSGVTSSIQNQIDAKATTLFVNGSNVGLNGTSEQTLRTVTIPANTISSTGILKVTVQGYLNLNATGSATLKVKLGGNTFFTFVKNYGDSDSEFEVVLYISNLRGIYTGTSYNDGNGVGTQMLADRKVITTDFTISRDLIITAQGSVAANGASLDHLIVERA